ncbi:phage minor head protein [Rubinisphaera brasiliensis]|uniref:Phage head morphogenesis domain-containing protein n=1 Tax=Rubinisphaera brasiliensis (strain ATCC 49424 / DSM 5305 / JCM 21570 / IAM 15109 / NBRC 103401 / IFAM 1448) TaxID=756272 RepID=F0SNL4_RUBBR|nr:phage minor head protein [Rubinisphaera brasiliensis]ADY57848.1 hypothetical protein Plabr_0219 [Rubinisphaera brasiliensis DSM 5305]
MELPNRDKLEAGFFRRLNGLSRQHRKELEQHLAGTLDYSRVPQAFWERVEKQREDEIAAALVLLFILAGDQMNRSGEMSRKVVADRAELWAGPKAREIATGYVQHSRDRLKRASDDWQKNIQGGDGAELKPPIKETAQDVFSPQRDEAISVTATTEARAAGGEVVSDLVGTKSPDDYWQTEEDSRVCPICSPLNDAKRDVWEAKFPMGPPAHPHCRCQIIYVGQMAEA